MPHMKSLTALRSVTRTPGVWSLGRWPVLAALGALLMTIVPARADVTQIMREIQRNGSARVIITMKTGEQTRAAWSRTQTVEQQRSTVATIGARVVQQLQTAN